MSDIQPDNSVFVPPSRPKYSLRLWGMVALAVLLLIGGCVGAAYLSGSRVSQEAKGNADRFLTLLEHADYAHIRPILAVDFGDSAESMPDIMSVLVKRHGKPTGHTGPTGWFVHTDEPSGVQRVRFGYVERFQQGDVPLQLEMVNYSDNWEVAGCHFQF